MEDNKTFEEITEFPQQTTFNEDDMSIVEDEKEEN